MPCRFIYIPAVFDDRPLIADDAALGIRRRPEPVGVQCLKRAGIDHPALVVNHRCRRRSIVDHDTGSFQIGD